MSDMKAYAREYENHLVKPARKEWALTLKNIGTIGQDTILEEAADHSRLDVDTLRHALNALTNAAVLYLKVGHGVQFGNFGSLQPSINAKAVTKKEDCTVRTMIGGVKINMQPTGTFAKAIAAMKVRLDTSASGITDAADPETENPSVEEPNGSDNNGSDNESSVDRTDPAAGQFSLVYRDAEGETLVTHHYNEGETIVPIEAPEGYRWPDSLPTVMPADNVRIQCVAA